MSAINTVALRYLLVNAAVYLTSAAVGALFSAAVAYYVAGRTDARSVERP